MRLNLTSTMFNIKSPNRESSHCDSIYTKFKTTTTTSKQSYRRALEVRKVLSLLEEGPWCRPSGVGGGGGRGDGVGGVGSTCYMFFLFGNIETLMILGLFICILYFNKKFL